MKNLEVLIFSLFSMVLILWGPFLRLYSVPVSLLLAYIAFVADKTFLTDKSVISKKEIITSFVLLFLSAIGYLAAVQLFDGKDLGMFKVSKFIALSFSLTILLLFLAGTRKKINIKKKYILIAILIAFINLAIFTDRFRYTRFKYQTIVQAAQTYEAKYQKQGKLGYLDESGVEMWYLKDFNEKYSFLTSSESDLHNWIKDNQIKYLLVTQEMGKLMSKKVKPYNDYLNTLTVLEEYQSPFFGGDTKIVRVSN